VIASIAPLYVRAYNEWVGVRKGGDVFIAK